MEKRRLSKILAKADAAQVRQMAEKIRKQYEVTVIKAPEKSLTMIKMRDPVKETLFFLGEVIVCEAIVCLDGTKGMAVIMGDDFEKVLDMAIIDAAGNKGVFTDEMLLVELEKAQQTRAEKENAMFMQTMVNFTTMTPEA